MNYVFPTKGSHLIKLIFYFGLTALTLSSAEAKRPKRSNKLKITNSLKGIYWSMSSEEVFGQIEDFLKERYDKKVKQARDDIEIDRLRRDQRELFKKTKENFTKFNGQRTGYDISMLKDDFAHNNSESVLRMDDRETQRYYFFKMNQLWKLVLVYPSQGEFSDFVKNLSRQFGRSKKVDWDTPNGGRRQMVSAQWEDKKTMLVVEDASAFHSKYIMRFISAAQGKEIQSIHTELKESSAPAYKAPELGVDIFSEEEDSDSVVDQITGVSHDVDLNRINKDPKTEVMLQEEVSEEEARRRKKKRRKKKR